MRVLSIYDPAMCCSTGLCGPSIDPELARFAADLDWLQAEGVTVERFNLAQQPAAFAAEPLVRVALQERGEQALPLVVVDGIERSSGVYPGRAALAEWAGVSVAQSVWTEEVAELVAIAASVASGCVSCLSAHEQRARMLGVDGADVRRAVASGQAVRQAAAGRIDEHAARLLDKRRTPLPIEAAVSSPCCAPGEGGSAEGGACC